MNSGATLQQRDVLSRPRPQQSRPQACRGGLRIGKAATERLCSALLEPSGRGGSAMRNSAIALSGAQTNSSNVHGGLLVAKAAPEPNP